MKHIKCFHKAPVCLVWNSYCDGEGELAVIGPGQTSALELGWGQGHDKASEGQAQPGCLYPPEEVGAAPCTPLTPAAMKGNLKSYQEGPPRS